MKKRIFPLIIALSALAVSGSAAFYSVFGLSKLFAGASLQVIIMAGSLEFAKLVVASLLYQYWDEINKVLRLYLSIACFVLILITSGGIYGFLSGAYQTTATKSELLDKSLAILNQKQIRFEEQKTDLTLEKTQLNKTISDLRTSLSNPTSVSYYDKEAEQVITTTSSSTRRALQKELNNTINDRDDVNLKLEAILDSVSTTDMALLDKEIDNEAERELGPLKYLSQITGKPMDQVVNWFLLLIVFVFDPLAIALVIAANFAFSKLVRKEEEVEDYFIHRNKHLEKLVENKIEEEPFEEEKWIPKTEEFDNIPEEIKDKEDQLMLDTEESEKRMNIIGQNGNDGLHYDKIEPTKEDLDKLETHLNNLKTTTDELYYKEDYTGDLDRLTDTTQTLIVDKPEEKIDEKRTLKYRKRN